MAGPLPATPRRPTATSAPRPSPSPHRRVEPPASCPPLPTMSPTKGAPSPPCHPHPFSLSPLILHRKCTPSTPSHPSSPSTATCPRWLTGLPPHRLRATTPFFSTPLDELHRTPIVRPFWTVPRLPCPLVQLQDSSTPSLATRHGTPPRQAIFSAPPPPAVSGESPATLPCPAQQQSLPHGVPTGRATPRPLAKPRPRARVHHTVTRPSTRAQRRLAWAGWAIVPLG
jgi:hypothetical protein